jgi:hypothetical protein
MARHQLGSHERTSSQGRPVVTRLAGTRARRRLSSCGRRRCRAVRRRCGQKDRCRQCGADKCFILCSLNYIFKKGRWGGTTEQEASSRERLRSTLCAFLYFCSVLFYCGSFYSLLWLLGTGRRRGRAERRRDQHADGRGGGAGSLFPRTAPLNAAFFLFLLYPCYLHCGSFDLLYIERE